MKNLDQIRAKNALSAAAKFNFAGENEGEVVKKVPALIQECGLLATAAFASEKGKGHENVFNAVIGHLADPEIALLSRSIELKDFIKGVAEKADSAALRRITSETMAYLSYLRRFAK